MILEHTHTTHSRRGEESSVRPLDSILIRPDFMEIIEIRPRPQSSQPKARGLNDVHIIWPVTRGGGSSCFVRRWRLERETWFGCAPPALAFVPED